MSATHTRFLILPILFSALVFADLVPIIPRPGDSFSAFSECTIGWEADTSGTWKNITIGNITISLLFKIRLRLPHTTELMTGSNTNAIPLMNVISGLDGTDPEKNRYSWICPDVDPNSNIYFYQVHMI